MHWSESVRLISLRLILPLQTYLYFLIGVLKAHSPSLPLPPPSFIPVPSPSSLHLSSSAPEGMGAPWLSLHSATPVQRGENTAALLQDAPVCLFGA